MKKNPTIYCLLQEIEEDRQLAGRLGVTKNMRGVSEKNKDLDIH